MFDVPPEAIREETHPLEPAASELERARPWMLTLGVVGLGASSSWLALMVLAVVFSRRRERMEAMLGAGIFSIPAIAALVAAALLLRAALSIDRRRPESVVEALSAQVPVWALGALVTVGVVGLGGLMLALLVLAGLVGGVVSVGDPDGAVAAWDGAP